MIRLLVLSCFQATYLVEKRREAGLSLLEHAQLKLHLSLCGCCAEYEKDVLIIDSAMEKLASAEDVSVSNFSEEEVRKVKDRILQKIKDSPDVN